MDNSIPIVSVITINLNMEAGLSASLDSYTKQKNSNEYELIVIDGMSSDGSQEVINRNKSRIDKCIIEKDKGIFDAMNKGIKVAKGRYIYFLNSGDIFYDDFVLQNISQIIKINNFKHNIYCGKVETYFGSKLIGFSNAGKYISHQGAFVKNDIMKKHLFDEKCIILGDLDLWKRIMLGGEYKIKKVDEIIAKSDLGIGSLPSSFSIKLKDKIYLAKKHGEYLASFLSIINSLIFYILSIVFGEKKAMAFYAPLIFKLKSFYRNL